MTRETAWWHQDLVANKNPICSRGWEPNTNKLPMFLGEHLVVVVICGTPKNSEYCMQSWLGLVWKTKKLVDIILFKFKSITSSNQIFHPFSLAQLQVLSSDCFYPFHTRKKNMRLLFLYPLKESATLILGSPKSASTLGDSRGTGTADFSWKLLWSQVNLPKDWSWSCYASFRNLEDFDLQKTLGYGDDTLWVTWFFFVWVWVGWGGVRRFLRWNWDVKVYETISNIIGIWQYIYMIWYDMIWYDMIWYDMIWYDMIYIYIYV